MKGVKKENPFNVLFQGFFSHYIIYIVPFTALFCWPFPLAQIHSTIKLLKLSSDTQTGWSTMTIGVRQY